MDIDQEGGRFPDSSPTRPLRLRNQHSPDRVARNQHLNDENHQSSPSGTRYPPRTTSLHRGNDQDAFSRAYSRKKNHGRQKSNNSSAGRSTQSSAAYTSISDPSARGSKSTAPSPTSSYHSGSTEIIGNFIPVDNANMALSPLEEERHTGFRDTQTPFSRNKRVVNPYEFEPGTPYVVEDARQTTFSDFMGNETSAPSQAMGVAHMNMRSEGNVVYQTQMPNPLIAAQSYPSRHALHRSESSPRLNSGRSPERHNRSPSPGISRYYAEDETSAAPARRGRSRSRNSVGRDHPVHDDVAFSTPSRQRPVDTSTTEDFCSPNHDQSQNHGNRFPPRSSSPTRPSTRSPTRILDIVSEHAEHSSKLNETDFSVNRTPSPPKKRSRSPMKRMFGEHGWLGRSPDDSQAGNHSSKKSSAGPKEKSSVMGKLRSKIEELAEKADLSPTSRGTRSREEKAPKISVLSVSLGPPEQARIYMEVELMLVHTGNNFLMSQFTQGRMAIDSIKKTVDTWKAKGRPTVLEFMYDQATQRDLIAVNQHNLRFYGERASDSVRISATLYIWKQVASFMAIRTFCDADTIILKLLFDIEQILELLGAKEPILLRLQQIRASSNETMRVSRTKDQNHTR